ncbi:hypothetical protein SNE40_002539 [Patella caerulea]|uniref:CCHC-type domain-containing protein n=1 Tax=Patella caerulea TaxID=87958 RepID=A0AAN8Q7K4_PATCE
MTNEENTTSTEKRSYSKECLVEINVVNLKDINIDDFIQAVEDTIGEGQCYACVPRGQGQLEITVSTTKKAKKLSAGVKVGDRNYECRMLFSPFTIVSFMNIPPYIDDDIIVEKLRYHGIELVSDVIRHYYKNHRSCENGTRHVKCRFPDHIKSLPWAMNFDTIDGLKSFRVIHNNQTKVCFKCFGNDHVIAECPNIKCRRCFNYGHMGTKCPASRCDKCFKFDHECICELDVDDDTFSSNSEENMSSDEGENFTNIKIPDDNTKTTTTTTTITNNTGSKDRSKDSIHSDNKPKHKKQKLDDSPNDDEAHDVDIITINEEITPTESTRNDDLETDIAIINENDYSIIPETAVKTPEADDTRGGPNRRGRLITSPNIKTILDVVSNRIKKNEKSDKKETDKKQSKETDKTKEKDKSQDNDNFNLKEKDAGGRGRIKKKS